MRNHIMKKMNRVWKKLSEKAYRDAYVNSSVNDHLTAQLFYMRSQRDLTQKDLSSLTGMRQSRISSLEKDCRSANIKTLRRIASALDVALKVEFVPFSELVNKSQREKIDRIIPSFDNDSLNVSVISQVVTTSSSNTYSTSLSEGSMELSAIFNTQTTTNESTYVH